MTANVVDPGVVNTELYKHVFWVVKVAIWMTAWLFLKVGVFFIFVFAMSLHGKRCHQHRDAKVFRVYLNLM